ncbi:MAG TPA: S1/P1 nuclease [Rhizomicrobium sp.]|nr:S1/P1 nuclease [Rhizomicrobium sp.]
MTRVLLLAFLSLVPVLLPARALAWGAEGHEIIAAVALHELSPPARRQVAALLGSEAMLVHDSNWADEIREQRPQTGPWHYVDIPLGANGYDARRDCGGGDCVVAQIGDDISRLGDRRLPPQARAEALRFLIHFVGDIHQPLHAVDDDDRGGNAVRVYLPGDRTNLHHIWDTEAVEALGPDIAAIADDIVRTTPPVQKKSWQAGDPAAWATESYRIARDGIYPMVRGRHTMRLKPAYLRDEAPIVRLQLAKAGVRLAWLLNTALR